MTSLEYDNFPEIAMDLNVLLQEIDLCIYNVYIFYFIRAPFRSIHYRFWDMSFLSRRYRIPDKINTQDV